MKNAHGEVLLFVKLWASSCNVTKTKTRPWVVFTFLNCTNGTKSRKASHIDKVLENIYYKYLY